ncbi:hypothetical protein [Paenibacillus roseipurpureus]|uniref:Uncharacterized protein n=1 Tax=Paenibacillus roseopurpureus TaxID=2918901 RepID=A0AA96RJ26_9BACL|nr:hypothetical protein [Paenibacillus sp. MBLB1832]WNR42711.1 hypothetical protein MJB10_16475 [Paenibacillus sp. MBLB1832]
MPTSPTLDFPASRGWASWFTHPEAGCSSFSDRMRGIAQAQRWIFQRQVGELGAPRILKLDYPASAIECRGYD